MCGLVGMAGNITVKHEKAFKELLVIDAIRGPHSTGVASVSHLGHTEVVKHTLLPHDFFQWQPFTKLMARNHNVLIGHNRWATKGVINKVNAHPFQIDKIMGVHNGTLKQQSLLPDSNSFDVDSENIFHSINKIGVAETTKKLNGAYALVWWDEEDQTLHFLRNKERDFAYTYAEDGGTVFWASEGWMLEGILGRLGIEHGPITESAVGMEYTFKIPRGFPGASYPVLPKPTCIKRDQWVAPVYHKPKKTPLLSKPKGNKSKNKVVPIKKGKELTTGSVVTFAVVRGSSFQEPGYEFKGMSIGAHSVEVVIHGTTSSITLKNALLEAKGLFTATVNSFYRFNDEVYKVIVQVNSVKQVEAAEEEEPVVETRKFNTYEGEVYLDRSEYEDLTVGGCINCQQEAPAYDDFAMYFGEEGDICKHCVDLPIVQEYLSFNVMDYIKH